MTEIEVIRTPDQRVRVFVSSTMQELAPERQAVRDVVTRLRLVPVMRSRLGDAAFETAWAYGRSIAGKRAVEYALNRQTSTPDRSEL